MGLSVLAFFYSSLSVHLDFVLSFTKVGYQIVCKMLLWGWWIVSFVYKNAEKNSKNLFLDFAIRLHVMGMDVSWRPRIT